MSVLDHQHDLERAIRGLVDADPRLAAVLARSGMPRLRRRRPGFAGLGEIIVGQQLSTASARAVWARLSAGLDPLDAATVLATEEARLGELGLSRAKVKTFKALAAAIVEGRLTLDDLASLEADVAHARLCALPGIGPWTADVYLLFCLGHADAWPAGDLAVQEGVRVGFGLAARPASKAMIALAEPWRPFRGAAAHLWWEFYRAIRGRDGAVIETNAGGAAE